jgi:hypothetical protein
MGGDGGEADIAGDVGDAGAVVGEVVDDEAEPVGGGGEGDVAEDFAGGGERILSQKNFPLSTYGLPSKSTCLSCFYLSIISF